MILPDPEEQDREGPPRHNSPEETDAAFARIVAGLRPEPEVPRRPAESRAAEGSPAEEDHFEPPEPPLMPVPRSRTVGGLALLAVGVLLLVGPSLLSLGEGVATPLGLLALTAGIGWLVIGLRSGPPPEGWDDGARL